MVLICVPRKGQLTAVREDGPNTLIATGVSSGVASLSAMHQTSGTGFEVEQIALRSNDGSVTLTAEEILAVRNALVQSSLRTCYPQLPVAHGCCSVFNASCIVTVEETSARRVTLRDVIDAKLLAIDGPDLFLSPQELERRTAMIEMLLVDLLCFADVLRREGLVHSNLSPSCIAVEFAPDDRSVQLAAVNGFEYACLMPHVLPSQIPPLTAAEVPHAAPEQLLGCCLSPDPATDLWAIGVMILEVAVGRQLLSPNICSAIHRIAIYDAPGASAFLSMRPTAHVPLVHEAAQSKDAAMKQYAALIKSMPAGSIGDEGECLPPPAGLQLLAYSPAVSDYSLESLPSALLGALSKMLRFCPQDRPHAAQILSSFAAGLRSSEMSERFSFVPPGRQKMYVEVPPLVDDKEFYQQDALLENIVAWFASSGLVANQHLDLTTQEFTWAEQE